MKLTNGVWRCAFGLEYSKLLVCVCVLVKFHYLLKRDINVARLPITQLGSCSYLKLITIKHKLCLAIYRMKLLSAPKHIVTWTQLVFDLWNSQMTFKPTFYIIHWMEVQLWYENRFNFEDNMNWTYILSC